MDTEQVSISEFGYPSIGSLDPSDIKRDKFEQAKILVCEDEAIVAADLCQALKIMGHAVLGVADCAGRAIDIVSDAPPDIALMDIMLNGDMNGIQLARLLDERYQIPSIYLTAHTEGDLVEQAKRSNPIGYLVKPYSLKELYSTIELGLFKQRNTRDFAEPYTREKTGLLRVLVIDDEPVNVDIVQRFFCMAGFDCYGFDIPEQGLDWYSRHASEVDLVFLDLNMPGVNGNQCYKYIRSLNQRQRIAFISGYFEPRLLEGIDRSQVAGFFDKPVDLKAVVKWAKELCLEKSK